MTKTIKLNQTNFIKYLFLYFAVMLIYNYIKTDYLIKNLVEYGVDIALLSGHISSTTSSIFIILRIIMILVMCSIIKDLFFEEVKNESIFDAIKTVIIVFIIVELIRMILFYFILIDEIKDIDISKDIVEQLGNTKWFYLNSLIYILLTIYGSLTFGIYFYIKEHKVIPAFIFSLIFFCSFFFSNIAIFNN